VTGLRYELMRDWPPRAWLATCERGTDVVTVRHGPRVECRPGWFCEAVWDGDFAAGDFDRTDVIFGSGGRLREGALVLVSAASTLDRLCSFEIGRGILVSNSLVCLAASAGLSFDPAWDGYRAFFRSPRFGLRSYERVLPSSGGPVVLTLYRNLRWDGQTLEEADKPAVTRSFPDFAAYRSFLARAMQGLAANMADGERGLAFRPIASASSGYDSGAVTTLAREIGCAEAIAFERARLGADDSGGPLIRHLGLRAIVLSREAWRAKPFAEVPFLAAEGSGRDVFFAAASDLLEGRVLFSGYFGDRVWDRTGTADGSDFQRAGMSGLSLSEHRLWTGFIHAPVAYLAARQHREIVAISQSDDMKPWDVGGDYSRPIPRRIIEEAGVPRALFGNEKRAAGVFFFRRHELDRFLPDGSETKEDYRRWLQHHRTAWLRSGRIPPSWWDAVARRARLLPRERIADYLFPWAMARAVRRYDPGASHGWPPSGETARPANRSVRNR
jgi:hypothetical protein